MTIYAILPPEEPEVSLDELAVAGFEIDRPASGDEASIGRGQTDDIGHIVRPGEWQRRQAGHRPPAELPRCSTNVLLPPMSGRGTRDPRIRCRSKSLRPVLTHALIYAYASRRGQVTTTRKLSSKCANAVAQIGGEYRPPVRITRCPRCLAEDITADA